MINHKKCIVCGKKSTKERIIGGNRYGFCKNHGVWDLKNRLDLEINNKIKEC